MTKQKQKPALPKPEALQNIATTGLIRLAEKQYLEPYELSLVAAIVYTRCLRFEHASIAEHQNTSTVVTTLSRLHILDMAFTKACGDQCPEALLVHYVISNREDFYQKLIKLKSQSKSEESEILGLCQTFAKAIKDFRQNGGRPRIPVELTSPNRADSRTNYLSELCSILRNHLDQQSTPVEINTASRFYRIYREMEEDIKAGNNLGR